MSQGLQNRELQQFVQVQINGSLSIADSLKKTRDIVQDIFCTPKKLGKQYKRE